MTMSALSVTTRRALHQSHQRDEHAMTQICLSRFQKDLNIEISYAV